MKNKKKKKEKNEKEEKMKKMKKEIDKKEEKAKKEKVEKEETSPAHSSSCLCPRSLCKPVASGHEACSEGRRVGCGRYR